MSLCSKRRISELLLRVRVQTRCVNAATNRYNYSSRLSTVNIETCQSRTYKDDLFSRSKFLDTQVREIF